MIPNIRLGCTNLYSLLNCHWRHARVTQRNEVLDLKSSSRRFESAHGYEVYPLNIQKYGTFMKYRIDARYVWYNRGTMIVLMYFINQLPFTFDELPDESLFDLELIKLADNERRFEPEDLYQSSYYLMLEECHPLLYELDLENPEMLPVD